MSRSIQTRLALYEKQQGKCFWCGKHMIFFQHPEEKYIKYPSNMVTVDHVYPKCNHTRKQYAERKRPSPIVLACRECNCKRSNTKFGSFAHKMGIDLKPNWYIIIKVNPELVKG
jgi:ssDNA-binding Zn-finger/Zn-ribbon topoisomerase 1